MGLASTEDQSYEGKVIKGNRNALYLVQNGQRLQFPDFYTFTQMGFNMSVIQKIPDPIMHAMPLGTPIRPISVYRPEDFMYHRVCSDPDRLVGTFAHLLIYIMHGRLRFLVHIARR